MMKIQGEYLLREAAGTYFLIPAGQSLADNNHMMKLNESGVFLWNCLQAEPEQEELLDKFQQEYPDISREILAEDLEGFLQELEKKQMLKRNHS